MSYHDNTPDHGDFVESEDEGDVMDSAEPVEGYYSESPYYPTYIGQILAERYRIEHKLGHGGFSTVWMAYDMSRKVNVALKILVSGDAGEYELGMQKLISQTVRDTSKLLLYTDKFLLLGHKGSHWVLVLPMRGSHLSCRLLTKPLSARMSAAKQLLEALGHLHHSGIIHRDLNDRNVMWGIIPLDDYNTNTKYAQFGRPQKIAAYTDPAWQALYPDWRPELVSPVEIPENLMQETIYLGDFGLAITAGTSVSFKVQTPRAYCAPERLHNIDPSLASDMWSYMVLFMQLYLGTVPFRMIGRLPELSSIVDCLGPLPQHWKGHYNGRDKGSTTSDDSWYDQGRGVSPETNLRKLIDRTRPEISQSEKDLAYVVLSRGFCYEPGSRLSAAQLIQDVSFNALLQLY